METSRIFIKGLPPNLTEADFRKHFSAQGREVTDVKLIPQRRIGYVGYKSAEDAAKAIKYFNKSYIRMSKIAVEPARAVSAERGDFFPFRLGDGWEPAANGMLDLRPCLGQGQSRHPTRCTGDHEGLTSCRRWLCCRGRG